MPETTRPSLRPAYRCTLCRRILPEDGFYPGYGGRTPDRQCKECLRERVRARYKPRQQVLDEIKTSRGCADCGYNANPRALEFDHLPGAPKSFTIGPSVLYRSLDELLAEVAKCEVVCANCHHIRTAERGFNYAAVGEPDELEVLEDPQLHLFD